MFFCGQLQKVLAFCRKCFKLEQRFLK